MEHFAMHKPSKIHPSLLPKVSDKLRCGNMDSAVYYYHSDHLGSASWITNKTGTPVQHLQYMPYGEPLVNERTTGSYEERSYSPLLHYHYVSTSLTVQIPNGNAIANLLNLLHTGKERDSETGFSYFGARYYDSDILTGWLSVDPLADKYPGLSPYAYCGWNPIKLVDPDGEEIIAALVGAAIKASTEIVSQTISGGFSNLNNGKGFFEGWVDNIDWADVGISAVEGFANGLIPGSAKVAKLAVEGGAMVLRSSTDLCAHENSDGKIVFRSVLSKKPNRKGFGEIGIDMCGEFTSFLLGKSMQIDNITFTQRSFAECAFETGLRGSLSGVVSTSFEYWKADYKRRNPYVKTPIIIPGPLENAKFLP